MSPGRLELLCRHQADKYRRLWRSGSYAQRSPAVDGWSDILPALRALGTGGQVADVGCGTGRILPFLHAAGYQPQGWDVDPALSLDADVLAWSVKHAVPLRNWRLGAPVPDFVSVVLCIDVLEHVPAELQNLALDQLSRAGKRGAVLGISSLTDQGRKHCCVRDPDWWRKQLLEHWPRVELRPVSVRHPRQNPSNWQLWLCRHGS